MNTYCSSFFIRKITNLFGKTFDFSKVKYINRDIPIILICNKCKTEFQIKPRYLYENRKTSYCPVCGRIERAKSKYLTTDTFIQKAQIIHGNKYGACI